MKNAINMERGAKQTDIIVYKASSQTKSVLFRMKYNRTQQRCELDTLSTNAGYHSVSEENLQSLLNLVASHSSTNNYSMLTGCHGSGWTPKGSDETMPRARAFGGIGKAMQYDVSDLTKAISQSSMRKMEYICFDDCYMANVETAYELKDVTNYLIASTSEVMGDGMPYDDIFKYMLGEPNYEKWVQGFYNHYVKSDTPYGALSAIRCGKSIENMAQVMKAINQTYTLDAQKMSEIQFLDGYNVNVFYDLSSYVDKLNVLDPLLANFKTALTELVPYKLTTPYIYTTYRNDFRPGDSFWPHNTFKVNTFCGITISDPTKNSTVFTSKENTAWWKATH